MSDGPHTRSVTGSLTHTRVVEEDRDHLQVSWSIHSKVVLPPIWVWNPWHQRPRKKEIDKNINVEVKDTKKKKNPDFSLFIILGGELQSLYRPSLSTLSISDNRQLFYMFVNEHIVQYNNRSAIW